MNPEELIALLTEGLDATQAAIVRKQIEKDTVKSRIAAYKAQSEFDTIVAERAALQQELDGDPASKKVGTREYQKWYEKNATQAIEIDKKMREFDAKHGDGAFAKALTGEFPAAAAVAPPVTAGTPLTEAQIQTLVDARIAAGAKPATAEADVQRMVDARIQGAYAPKWSELLTDTGTVVQKHMYAKRTTPIDFKKLSEIAQAKNVSIEAAYDEWDKPEREKAQAADLEATIERRVNEEIQKRGATQVPGGADATPGALSAHKIPGDGKFDRTALLRDMQSDLLKIQ